MAKESEDQNEIWLLLLKYKVDFPPLKKLLSKHLLESDLEEVKEIQGDSLAKNQRFPVEDQD